MSITLTGKETKAELQTICEENGIKVDNTKPTNTILVDLIKSHEDYEASPTEGIPKLSEVPDDEIPGEVVDDLGNVLVKSTSKLEDVANDNERMIYISVTDHDNTQSVENDEENRLFQASWGNLICPVRQESVLVNGVPQYASRGMVKHMRSISIPVFTKDAAGNIKTTYKPRFSIQELEGWNEEQLEALKATQAGRLIK